MTWFLVLRAFSSGCTALTGVEAISNGVPAFKPPEARNASITMGWMAGILGRPFSGSPCSRWRSRDPHRRRNRGLADRPRPLGTGLFYYLVQTSTMLILILAANTSFADFPRLIEPTLPRPLRASPVCDSLAIASSFPTASSSWGASPPLLLIIFRGDTHALIPLYAVGVFLSFTAVARGMIRHWLTERGPGWSRRLVVNGAGAVVTGVVTLVIAVTKFTHGAWMVVLLIPVLVMLFKAVHRHYEAVATGAVAG